jgi:SAM-dependent methyltransferase
MIPARLRTRLRPILIRTPIGRRLWWRSHGRRDELDFWAYWLDTNGARWSDDYTRRVAPEPLIDDPLVTDWLDGLEQPEVRIIDVGAGPITKLGVRYPGKGITVVPVDPLAVQYERLLQSRGVEPPVRTIQAHGEHLLRHFRPESFDVAYAVNSLDHSYDPVRIIANMVKLVTSDGVVLLRHARNEGENERYCGLHQWNFDAREGDLVVWNHAVDHKLSEELEPGAQVEAWIEGDEVLVRVRPERSKARGRRPDGLSRNLRDGLRRRLRRLRTPARLGGLRRTVPVSDQWGRDRGTPIDRYYIERFLEREHNLIHGRVLELLDDTYTRRFGADLEQCDVLDVDTSNPNATIVADLARADAIPSGSFDCFILTQTLQFVYDLPAAVGHVWRILKPGGVVLCTLPSVSRIARRYLDTEFWRFTTASTRTLFETSFGPNAVDVESHGNVLTSIAFLAGLAAEELSTRELEEMDPYFPLLVCVVARRAPE